MAGTDSVQQVAKLSETERQAFTDAYRFWERHHDMPNTVEAWDGGSDEIKEIISRYEDPELVGNLLSALFLTIDRRIRRELKGKA